MHSFNPWLALASTGLLTDLKARCHFSHLPSHLPPCYSIPFLSSAQLALLVFCLESRGGSFLPSFRALFLVVVRSACVATCACVAEWDGMGRDGTGDEDPLEAVSHHHQLLNGELDSLALGIPTEGREGLI